MLTTIHRTEIRNAIPSTSNQLIDSRLKTLYSGNDIHGNHSDYIEKYLRHEMEASEHNPQYNIINFISFSGNLNGVGYLPAYGFETLPVPTIKSLKFKTNNRKMKQNELQQLLHYYEAWFPDDVFYLEDNIPFGTPTDTYSIVKNEIARFNSVKILGHQYNSKEM